MQRVTELWKEKLRTLNARWKDETKKLQDQSDLKVKDLEAKLKQQVCLFGVHLRLDSACACSQLMLIWTCGYLQISSNDASKLQKELSELKHATQSQVMMLRS